MVGAAALIVIAAWVSAAGAARPPSVRITTVVTTTVPIYEFTTWFGVSAIEISCEIDHHGSSSATPVANEAYCMSASSRLTHHVTVSATGVVKTCRGAACGSNAGLGTPSFFPGTEVRSGPFACVVSAKAVTCRAHGLHGFIITASSITRL